MEGEKRENLSKQVKFTSIHKAMVAKPTNNIVSKNV